MAFTKVLMEAKPGAWLAWKPRAIFTGYWLIRITVILYTLEQLEVARIEDYLIPPIMAVPCLPTVTLSSEQIAKCYFGTQFPLQADAHEVVAVDHSGRMIAVMAKAADGLYKPATNFAHYWRDRNEHSV